MNYANVERRAEEIEKRLTERLNEYATHRSFSERSLTRLLAECMRNDGLRTALFRFVDVFPALRTDHEIACHFVSYVGAHRAHLPFHLGILLPAADQPLALHIAARVIKQMVRAFADHFIVDSANVWKVRDTERDLRGEGCDITWDILGEEALSPEEADEFMRRYLALIKDLGSRPVPAGFTNNISVKLSSLVPKAEWDPINFDGTVKVVSGKLLQLFRAGYKNGVAVNVDMESYAVRDLTLAIFKRAFESDEFCAHYNAGIVVQAYLCDAEESLRDLLSWIERVRRTVTIRLVKGAYWDHEVMNAEERGWPVPVLTDKAATDRQFQKLAEMILTARKYGVPVKLAAGSHNAESLAYTIALAEELGERAGLEIQVLYGMGDDIRRAVRAEGYPVRVYTPCGELVPSMAYLVRRLLENTSQQSFLGAQILGAKGGDHGGA
jgi:RHH-type proline utilization regulon transcriptional repressor/proline dehydrogenase/delta 1-pyrroline-5-carboxylate dehydrogenase